MGRSTEVDTKRLRIFVSYAHDSEEHKSLVRQFATFLRQTAGFDVQLDAWADTRRQDWAVWAMANITTADFVLVIASPAYRRRAEGGVASDDGRGVQFEASLLLELLCKDRRTWLPRLLPVVLPGRSVDEIPLFLQPYSATHYIVTGADEDGARELLAALRNRPLHPLPALGSFVMDPTGPVDVPWAKRDRAHDPVVNDLADDLSEHWSHEEERYSVHDPRPMLLRWSVTDAAKVAMAGVRWTSAGILAPERLSGDLSNPGDLISRVPTRRLVILGSTGAGKSVLTIRLARTLLAARSPGDPVPILLPLGAWNPDEKHLPDWIVARLMQDYKGLRRTITSQTGTSRTLAAILFTTGRIVPILDGLDEITEKLRGVAIAAINRLGPEIPLVITSRIDEYQHATRSAGRGLNRAAVVELHPLDRAETASYLDELRGVDDHWRPVITELTKNPEGPLAATLRVPLMLWLARTIYATKPTKDLLEVAGQKPDEDGRAALGSGAGQQASRRRPAVVSGGPDGRTKALHVLIEDHLLGDLVPELYSGRPVPAGDKSAFRHCTAEDAGDWLTFLARHLRAEGTGELAWWRLQRAVRPVAAGSRFLAGAALGFGLGQMLATATGAPAVLLGLLTAGILGLLATSERFLRRIGVGGDLELPHTFLAASRKVSVSRRVRNDVLTLLSILFRRSIGFLIMGVALSVLVNWPPSGVLPSSALLVLALLGLGHGLWSGVIHRKPPKPGTVALADPGRVAEPENTLRDDRKQTLAGTVPLVVIAVLLQLTGLSTIAVTVGAAGLAWFLSSAYSRFTITRFVLALSGRLPWRPMAFLDDAHRRGVLRQAGAVHQFRHPRLRDRLAEGNPPADDLW